MNYPESIKGMDPTGIVERNKLVDEIRQLTGKAADLRTQMADCVERKDAKGYASAEAELKLAEARADLLKNRLAMKPPFSNTRADVVQDWARYVREHNERFAVLRDEYITARRRLARQFLELVQFQNQALKVLDRANATIKALDGNDDPYLIPGDVRPDLAPLATIPVGENRSARPPFRDAWMYPDILAFCLGGDLPIEMMDALSGVIDFHTPAIDL